MIFDSVFKDIIFAIIVCVAIPSILMLIVKQLTKNKKRIKEPDGTYKKTDVSRSKAYKAEDFAKLWNPASMFNHQSMENLEHKGKVSQNNYYNDKNNDNKNTKSQLHKEESNTPECFKILGFDKKPSEEELKSKYRELVKKYHPDKTGGDSEMFESINEAYKLAKRYY